MRDEDVTLGDLESQGWKVEHYSASVGDSAMMEHCFHLVRHGKHMVVRFRKKMLGGGMVAEQIEV